MTDENDEQPRSRSVYDYSDKSIQHAGLAVLAYAGLRALSAIIGSVQQPSMAVWFGIDLVIVAMVLGVLAFGIHKRSRVAVVMAILYVVGTQLYVWFGLRSPAGTIVAVIVTGFLLRGAKRIFEFRRQQRDGVRAEN